MTWHYRVIKTKRSWYIGGKPYSEDHYQIHEVYYDKAGNIEAWSQDPMSPFGESLTELNSDINMFVRATILPVLEEVDGKLVEMRKD